MLLREKQNKHAWTRYRFFHIHLIETCKMITFLLRTGKQVICCHPVTPQMQLLFVDECEKYKDLIHVHSFAHDFHLRCINDYLRGNTSILHSDFHVSNFLSEFLQIYPIPPSFARNCLAQGECYLLHTLPLQVNTKCINSTKGTYLRVTASSVGKDVPFDPFPCMPCGSYCRHYVVFMWCLSSAE